MSLCSASSTAARLKPRGPSTLRSIIVVAFIVVMVIARTPAEAQAVPFGTPTLTLTGQTGYVYDNTTSLAENIGVALSVDGVEVATTTSDAGCNFTFTLSLAPYAVGLHDITFKLTGGGGLGYLVTIGVPSSFTIVPSAPTLSVASSVAGEVGSTVPLIAQFGAAGVSNALDIEGQTLTFYVDGVSVGTAETNASGLAVFNYQVPADAGTSVYYDASFAGTGGYSPSTSNYGTVAISAAATSLSSPGAAAPVGATAPLTTVLTNDTDGSPVSGVTVNFYVSGELVGSGTTDDTGTATYAYYVTEGAGAYAVNTVSVGDLNYGSTMSGAGTLTVTMADTVLVTPVKVSDYPTVPVTLTATLARTTDDRDLLGETAKFYVNGAYVGSGMTDAGGVASFTYVPRLAEGSYPVYAKFGGDDNYLASTSVAGSLVVKLLPGSGGNLSVLKGTTGLKAQPR